MHVIQCNDYSWVYLVLFFKTTISIKPFLTLQRLLKNRCRPEATNKQLVGRTVTTVRQTKKKQQSSKEETQ